MTPAQAEQLPIFDAHLHYNHEPEPASYSVDQVLDVFRRNGVTAILASSRPNLGTQELLEASARGLWVVPLIRPYVISADRETWFEDPSRWELIQAEYKRGYYRGIGEFHIFGEDARSPIVKQLVSFAVRHDLVLEAHCDEHALHILFSHDPLARIIWAHTGFTTPPARIAALMKNYPTLWAELSYTSGITENGQLTTEWRDLFASHSHRFMIGSDTWSNERWTEYDSIMREYRTWLAQLPEDQARRVSYETAAALFGPRPTN